MNQMQLQIKFDKRDLKIYKWLWIITGIVAFIGLIPFLMFLNKKIGETTLTQDKLFYTGLIMLYFGGGLWLIFSVKFAEAAGYLKRLEKYGFIVPDRKKSYQNDLDRLIQHGQACVEYESQKSRSSIILTVISGVLTVFAVVFNFTMTRMPHVIAILILIVMTGCFARQISPGKFRDDVDIYGDIKRKVRKNIPGGIVEILLIFAMTMVFFVELPDDLPFNKPAVFYHQSIRYEKERNNIYDLFPDYLPKNAEDVTLRCGYGGVCVSFYTTQEQIEEYMEIYGQQQGLTDIYTYENDKDFEQHLWLAETYIHTMNAVPKNENCYLYLFFENGFIIFMDKETGYVGMYGSYLFSWS